jgi:molybdopterin-guanine dinucleotide biosynthesis protein B
VLKKVVAFTGHSNSGKTTLISKVVEVIKESFSVTVIKNDPKDKAIFDTKGKDSSVFFESGADVVVTSTNRTTKFTHQRSSFETLLEQINTDFVLVEGHKYLDLPRICVLRDDIDKSYFPYSKAVAIKNIDKTLIPSNLEIINLDDINEVVSWCIKNAKQFQ